MAKKKSKKAKKPATPISHAQAKSAAKKLAKYTAHHVNVGARKAAKKIGGHATTLKNKSMAAGKRGLASFRKRFKI